MSDPLDKLYQEVFEDAVDYMEDHEVQAVAATYMAIAMKLYKTNLSQEGFLSTGTRLLLLGLMPFFIAIIPSSVIIFVGIRLLIKRL